MKRILFPTDFSACADAAWPYAVLFARGFGADLDILHVAEHAALKEMPKTQAQAVKDSITDFAQSRIQKYVEAAGTVGLQVQTHLVTGRRPSAEIAKFARDNAIDLVVMGSRGTSGIHHLIHGSTVGRVLKLGKVPVMAVHEQDKPAAASGNGARGFPLRKILVPVDFSACSLAALSFAISLVKEPGSELLVMHVLEDVFPIGFDVGMVMPLPDLNQGRIGSAEKRLQAALPPDLPAGVKVKTEVSVGAPSLEIIERARTDNVDLIVIGAHGADFMEELFLGSVTEKVTRIAPCPVITLPCR